MGSRRRWALGRFVVFAVLLALLPILFVYIVPLVTKTDRHGDPFAQGALFLLATTTAFSAVGALVARHPSSPSMQYPGVSLVVAAIAGLNGLLAALLYGAVANSDALDATAVLWLSASQYGITVIAGGACVVLIEEK